MVESARRHGSFPSLPPADCAPTRPGGSTSTFGPRPLRRGRAAADVLEVVGDELRDRLGLLALDQALGHTAADSALHRVQDAIVVRLDGVGALRARSKQLVEV